MSKLFKTFCVLAGVVLILHTSGLAQSKENGAIEGKVTTEDQLLPGVQIILSSPNMIGGNRAVITGENGRFRFVALQAGTYALEAKLEGFSSARKEGIRLSVGSTLTVDFAMTMGKIEENVLVKGILPMVDVKDSQTAVSTLSNEMMQNIPNNQFVSNIVNLAPGVSGNSAFGASNNGVQYQIDGVDTSDPELHTAFVFLDYGVIDEAKIMGIGAPAEYDGFSGIVFNTTTKSGGNVFSGMLDAWLQPKNWNSKNTTDPALTSPVSALDNIHFDIGGPFIKDKLWFFAAAQYYYSANQVAGFPEATAYKQPRLFLKMTWQPNQGNRLAFSLEGDKYQGVYRGASRYRDVESTRHQDSPELYFNLSYLHVFSDHTFFEAKGAGYIARYLLIPNMGYDVPGHYDYSTLKYTQNYSSYYHAYRNRYSATASLSHHAENFIKGSHDFKFGLDTEMNPCRSEWGYSGGIYYKDNGGQPYRAYQYAGYVTRAVNYRASIYLQDSWALTDKININPGIRFNYYRGKIVDVGTVFKPQISIAPRIGISYDLFNNHSTVLKLHYGQYYDNIITSFYTMFAPKPDFITLGWNGASWYERYRDVWLNAYTMDDKISMPYMNQFTVGIEREVIRDLSVSVNYIYRDNKDFIDRVNLTGEFEPFQYTDPNTGQTLTAYNQLNPGEDSWIITNPHKGQYPIVTIEPKRRYSGFEFVINKRFSNKWQVLASYVYGKATGNNDNLYGAVNNSSLPNESKLFTDPNYQINAEGHLYYDPTHMLKIQGSIILPLDINLGANFSYITGNPYAMQILVKGMNQDDTDVNAEPLGSRRLPAITRLDLRLEKIFKLNDRMSVGAMVDAFNVFNAGTVTEVTTEAGPYFEETDTIMNPRAIRVGLRFLF